MTTDPTTLAREVLDLTHEDDTITVCTVPDNKVAALARAVISTASALESLTAETDAWEESAWRAGGLTRDEAAIRAARETENRIRTALNGEADG